MYLFYKEAISKILKEQDCTCIIIAHHLKTIRDCDIIYVIDEHIIKESGSHNDLITLNGIYKKMVDRQNT